MKRNMASDICILVLLGLPASGKTSFTQFLVSHCNSEIFNQALGQTQVIPLSYDKLIPFDHRNHNGEQKIEWKEARKGILKHAEDIICKLKGRILPPNLNVSNPRARRNTTLIVIDDNMYYKSMRYEYFRLAKVHGASFCQIHFLTTLQKSLHCNALRATDERVPESVIYSMSEKFEPPNVVRNSWEQFTLTLASHDRLNKRSTQKLIYQTIVTSIENSVKPCDIDNTLEFKQECAYHVVNNTNYLHEIDLTLRRIVGERLKSFKNANAISDRLAVSSRQLSLKKYNILREFKTGKTILPGNIRYALEQNDEYYKTILYEHLSEML